MGAGYIDRFGCYNERQPKDSRTELQKLRDAVTNKQEHIDFLKSDRDKWRMRAERALREVQLLANQYGFDAAPTLRLINRGPEEVQDVS